ncbi:MAG: RidA family protein [Armatimonadetes bacterium]|nr:RidA family protein [Armatimonadota bacterium]
MNVQRVSTNSPWEPVVGYSRAVRRGNIVAVTGTVGLEADGSASPSLQRQAERSLEIIVETLGKLGASPSDVIRTRMFVTDISRWQEVAAAHAAVFGDVLPATTMVEVSRLISPEYLIEIEADAVLDRD